MIDSKEAKAPAIDGVVIGLVLAYRGSVPLVVFPGNPVDQAIQARSLVRLGPEDVGREVALLFEDGDRMRPLILGRLVEPARSDPSHGGSGRRANAASDRARTYRTQGRQGQSDHGSGWPHFHPRNRSGQPCLAVEPDPGWLGEPELRWPSFRLPKSRPFLSCLISCASTPSRRLSCGRSMTPRFCGRRMTRIMDAEALTDLVERLEAHLDGLRISGAAGLKIAEKRYAEFPEPGELFVREDDDLGQPDRRGGPRPCQGACLSFGPLSWRVITSRPARPRS